MLRSRAWVVAFVGLQVALPLLALAVRFARDGWYADSMLRFSWQMFSAVR